MAKDSIKGYNVHKDEPGGVSLTSKKTGKTYHEPSVAAAKKLAHLHEMWSHMGGK